MISDNLRLYSELANRVFGLTDGMDRMYVEVIEPGQGFYIAMAVSMAKADVFNISSEIKDEHYKPLFDTLIERLDKSHKAMFNRTEKDMAAKERRLAA